ncbi:hypothetical protein SFR_4962 [Streptomyces sp. FR-008]|nr:hypothetical protein SFR_4962 [Streptomyces sp. FR-008]
MVDALPLLLDPEPRGSRSSIQVVRETQITLPAT